MDNRSRIRRILWGTLRGIFLPHRALELMLRWEDAYSDLFDRDPIAVCTTFFRQEMSHTLTEIQCIDLAEELITILECRSGSLPQDPIVSVHRLRATRARNLLSTPDAMNTIEDQSSRLLDSSSEGPIDGSKDGKGTFCADVPTIRDAFVKDLMQDEMGHPPKFGRARAPRDTNEYPKITVDGNDDGPRMGDEMPADNSSLSIPTIPTLGQGASGKQASDELPVGLRPFSNARANHRPGTIALNAEAPKQEYRRSVLPQNAEIDPFYGLDRSTFARIFLEHD